MVSDRACAAIKTITAKPIIIFGPGSFLSMIIIKAHKPRPIANPVINVDAVFMINFFEYYSSDSILIFVRTINDRPKTINTTPNAINRLSVTFGLNLMSIPAINSPAARPDKYVDTVGVFMFYG